MISFSLLRSSTTISVISILKSWYFVIFLVPWLGTKKPVLDNLTCYSKLLLI